jgi:type IV pilus assembly protein PilM
MWFRRTKPLIGIDIGSHAIKLVRFGLTGTSYHLRDLAILQSMLRRLLTLEHIKAKDVALALSGHSVIVKKVQMVRMSEEELGNAMPYEAEQHIPFDVYDVNTDFQILSTQETNPSRNAQMEVLLAAAKKGRVEELTQVARGANLTPAVIDVDMLALINAFEVNYPEAVDSGAVAMVHLGASMMTVLIVKNGLTTFQRDIALGGNQYTAEIQRVLGLSHEEAEAVKLGVPTEAPPPANALAALQRVTQEVVTEIQRSFEFYLASAGDDPVERVYLSGGSSRMKGLSQVLESRLQLSVELLDPFRRIDVPEKLFAAEYVHDMGPIAAVAAGLALRQKGDR